MCFSSLFFPILFVHLDLFRFVAMLGHVGPMLDVSQTYIGQLSQFYWSKNAPPQLKT